jgi:hypothetical protein
VNILTIEVDRECSAELIERGIQANVDAEAIRQEREEIERDRAQFRDRPAEDFCFGEADAFRDRLTASLVRELRLRQQLAKIDEDHRRELAKLRDSRSLPELRDARNAVASELMRIGFAAPAEPGEADADKIAVSKLIDRHPRVWAAAIRAGALQTAANAPDFARQNEAEIQSLRTRIKSYQEAAARI